MLSHVLARSTLESYRNLVARLWTSGGEWSTGLAIDQVAEDLDPNLGAAPNASTTFVRSGSRSFNPQGTGYSAHPFTGALGTTYYIRGYFLTNGSGLQYNTVLFKSSTILLGTIRLETNNTLSLVFGNSVATPSGGTVVGTYGTALSLNTWYRLELAISIGTGSIDYLEGKIDGVTFASGTNLAISDTVPNGGGFQGDTFADSAWFDDVAINDSTGTSQNTWPGDGKVVLLLPISDNAKGTGWTNDAAGTTNFFDAVNNTPPAGVADTTAGTGLHQLRNATSNANVNYDANLTSYTTAGIGATDVVTVVTPVVVTGAPVVTSAKLGTVGSASNPTIANISLSAGGTSGAFWSGTAAGTHPTGWKVSWGTPTYNPTVVKGTSPVLRITQVTASTRIAMVDAMGMYVEYTAGAPPAPKSLIYADRRVARNALLRR